jgi:hypothetical protein
VIAALGNPRRLRLSLATSAPQYYLDVEFALQPPPGPDASGYNREWRRQESTFHAGISSLALMGSRGLGVLLRIRTSQSSPGADLLPMYGVRS